MKRPSTRAVLIGAIWATFGVIVLLFGVFLTMPYKWVTNETGSFYVRNGFSHSFLEVWGGSMWSAFLSSAVCIGPFLAILSVAIWMLMQPKGSKLNQDLQ